ncbi:hypothetical protein ACPCK8_32565 [Streptomyces cellulosae]
MGRHLCWIAPRPDDGLREDRRVLIAAAYRTSWRRVSQAGGALRPRTAPTPTVSPTT